MSAYTELAKIFKRLSALSDASGILEWDSAVMMPAGGAASRAEQIATLGVMRHEILTDPLSEELLDRAEVAVDQLDEWQAANLREMRHRWRHGAAVDADLVAALSRASSKCEMTWRTARAENDFSALAPGLGEVVSLTAQMAAAKADLFDCSPYDALIDQFEPGMTIAAITPLFQELENFLPHFLGKVTQFQKSRPFHRPVGSFDVEKQRALSVGFMSDLGFDFDHGRLDVSHHPFTGGSSDDVRITTRYGTDDFSQGLMGTLHETGHALYERGLPEDWRDQPIGSARGMVLHESQSLLVEMQLARSPAFLSYALPKIRAAFDGNGDSWQIGNITRLYHQVKPGLIRVDADEVTYPMHILLRTDLEQAMLNGDLRVTDLPGAWNDKMQALLGLTPPDDASGCMQDIHWPGGAFGYFPTYTLGALAAAQFFAALNADIRDVSDKVAAGEFGEIFAWLKRNIHSFGSRFSTNEVLIRATGSPLDTAAFTHHLENRYLQG